MKIFFKHKLTPRLGLFALLLLLGSSGIYAQTTDAKFIDGTFNVKAGEIVEWYGNVEMAPTATVYIEDGAKIYFYGDTLRMDAGATIFGTTDWVTFNAGTGTGRIVFQKPNSINNSTNQQVLIGGNAGSATANTLTSIEINNANGVKLSGSNARIGSNLIFTAGHLYVDVQDAVLSSTATITGADANKYVVTAIASPSGGHLVKESYSGSFVFPVGMADNDYTPATVAPVAAATIHVNVTNYAGDPPAETFADGIDRAWNIYGNVTTAAQINLQHNSSTNEAQWTSGANFVTRYGTNPNLTGDVTSGVVSAWQSNTPDASLTTGGAGTESRSRFYGNIAITATTNEAWYSKASNTVHPLNLVGVLVSPKVLLQGAVSGTTMTTTLNTLGLIPVAQPYNVAPFNYTGAESVASIPAGVTDWVLVELRDKTTPATIVATRAVFVKSDGSVVDVDGTSAVSFPMVTAGNYYVAIRHRNHLAIRTAAAQPLSNTATLYDFTSGQAMAYQDASVTTNGAMKDLGNNKFAMWGGNGANTGAGATNVRATGAPAINDYSYILTVLNGAASVPSVYSLADYNMDGTVRASGAPAVNDYTFLLNVLGANVSVSQHQ